MLRVHRANQTEFICNRAQLRQCFGNLHAAFAMAAEFKLTRKQNVMIVGLMDLHAVRMRLAAALRQFRLGVEQIHLAGTAILHQLDDGFGRAGEMALAEAANR